MPARRPVAPADEHMSPAGPSAKEVLREIGVTMAAHLAVALAIIMALQAYGIV